MIGSAFAAVLSSERERFNALFAQARRRAPQLDGEDFLAFLRQRIDPLIAVIAESQPGGVPAAVNAFYAIGLELFQRGLIGESQRYPGFETQWTEVMQALASALPADVSGLAAPLTNALHNLTVTPRCRSQEWVDRIVAVSALCASDEELRAAGQVAAWFSGMSHYREDALVIARNLPPAMLARLLGLRKSDENIIDQLAANRWFHPHNGSVPDELKILAETGGFRGLGGEFRRPPTVSIHDNQFLVSDGDEQWLLMADAFGATFHRIRIESPSESSTGAYRITPTGIVQGPKSRKKLELLASSSSQASNDDTLAVTLPHSHRVFLVSEAPE